MVTDSLAARGKTSPQARSLSRRVQFVVLLLSVVGIAAAILLSPTLNFSSALAALILFFVGFLIGRNILTREPGSTIPQNGAADIPRNHEDIFALGKLFDATLSGMREGLLVVNRDMRVVASNAAAHRLFKLEDSGAVSQRLTELTRNPAIYSAFVDALSGQERSGVKVETYGSDRRIFDLRVVPLSTSHDRVPRGAMGVFFDVTRLERLERVRQEFLSNVSHELRTPLTAILAFIETLESGAINEPETSSRFLEIIRKNAARMHTLIDDILELSAIEAGQVKVQTKQIELAPVVNEVIQSLTAKALARGITLENQVNPQEFVHADPRRLEQMLTNLIDNAIKFNREGGQVTVSHERGEEWERILIRDTGDGIPSQHLERLFERFYRVDRARSREMGGTGLGLAIVKHLARAHGGEVKVQSKLGAGSTFEISLPLVESSNPSIEAQTT